jgi:proline iminopeptidase
MIRESYLKVHNMNIWYSVYGQGTGGVPLLVLHGGPGFLSLPQVVSDLADARPVYFYDQLGCGRSDRAADQSRYTLDYYVRELAEVRRQLDLPEVYLLGFSWGAMLACSYLLQKEPAGIKGLILSGPYLSTPRWDADQRANIARLPAGVRQAIEDGEKAADYGAAYQNATLEYYRRHLCRLDPWPDFLQEALAKISQEVYFSMWGPSEFTITGSLKSLDLMSALPAIQTPVLLTCGDMDEAGGATVKDYQMAFPRAALAVLPRASHLHHIEQPEIYKSVVREFLAYCP